MGNANGKPPFDFGGTFDVTLLPDNRLRLPVGVTNQLREAGVAGLWLSILPRHPALLLCPASRWPAWRPKVKTAFKDLPAGEAERAAETYSKSIHLDPSNRFYLPARFQEHVCIQPGDIVRIIGLGDHFEIWRLEDTQGWTPESV